MYIIKFVLGVIGAIVAFVVAINLLGLLLYLVGIAVKLIWLAVIVGIFILIGWVIYKLFSPNHAEQV